MNIGEKIRQYRIARDLSQDDIAKYLGTTRQAVYKYESGLVTNIPIDKVERLADLFGVTPESLLGWETDKSNTVRIPVYGKVAAGIPTEAITDIEDYEEIDAAMAAKGDYMALTINGDSMEPKFSKGDVVIIRKQDCAETGDYVVVLVNGEDATCKKLKCTEDGIYLISTNPAYDPMFFTNKQIKSLPIRILGKVVELRAKFK